MLAQSRYKFPAYCKTSSSLDWATFCVLKIRKGEWQGPGISVGKISRDARLMGGHHS